MPGNLWCQWDLADVGERRRPCLRPTQHGAETCPAHPLPIWPTAPVPTRYPGEAFL